MADEQSRPPFHKAVANSRERDWQSLMGLDGDELETHFRHGLESLGKQKGMLGAPLVNLENGAEQSKMLDAEATTAKMDQQAKPAFSVEDLESGKIAIHPGWLKEVWGKWSGDESIEELLAALDEIEEGDHEH